MSKVSAKICIGDVLQAVYKLKVQVKDLAVLLVTYWIVSRKKGDCSYPQTIAWLRWSCSGVIF